MYLVQQLNSYWEEPLILLGPKSWQIVFISPFLTSDFSSLRAVLSPFSIFGYLSLIVYCELTLCSRSVSQFLGLTMHCKLTHH